MKQSLQSKQAKASRKGCSSKERRIIQQVLSECWSVEGIGDSDGSIFQSVVLLDSFRGHQENWQNVGSINCLSMLCVLRQQAEPTNPSCPACCRYGVRILYYCILYLLGPRFTYVLSSQGEGILHVVLAYACVDDPWGHLLHLTQLTYRFIRTPMQNSLV